MSAETDSLGLSVEGVLDLGIADEDSDAGDGHNVTDWALAQFRSHYGKTGISKDCIWEYMYGVMHAPDWRERYKHDLQRNLPRIPLADSFEAFRAAGRKLMDLHTSYETCMEHEVVCLVDGEPDEGDSEADAYRIGTRMRWGKKRAEVDGEWKMVTDRSVFEINDRCKLVGIPDEAHEYTVSGRTPLDWAIDSLRRKHDKSSGIEDDPNKWHKWDDEPFELVRHLRRLIHVSVWTAKIVAAMPPSLPAEPEADEGVAA